MTTLDERMKAFERLSLACKLDLLAREVFSQKYGNVFNTEATMEELNLIQPSMLEFQIDGKNPIRYYPHECRWVFSGNENYGGFPQPGFEQPVKVEKGRWISNVGGECPVEKGTLIEVEYRDGVKQVCQAMVNEVNPDFGYRKATSWTLDGFATDIVGYRVIPGEELHLYLEPEDKEPVMMTVKEANESLRVKHNEEDANKTRDAARYRWLREQHWSGGVIAVVLEPKRTVKLGADCPSGVQLDRIIDNGIGG